MAAVGAASTAAQTLVKVSSATDPKKVAGAIANQLREGGSPVVSAIGAQSLNQAIKSIIIARSYLERDGFDLEVKPSLVEAGKVHDGVTLAVARVPVGRATHGMPEGEAATDDILKASAASKPGPVAGAIAARARAGAASVPLMAIGPAAVLRALKSVALAVEYVAENGLVLCMQPAFTDVTLTPEGAAEPETRTAIVIHVLVSKGAAPTAAVAAAAPAPAAESAAAEVKA